MKDDLEARMKSEQHNIEGVGGILSSLKEQDQPQGMHCVNSILRDRDKGSFLFCRSGTSRR